MMKKFILGATLIALTLGLCSSAFAYQRRAGYSSGSVIANNIKRTTVGRLPGNSVGRVYVVTDGASATDCSTGGGSTAVICWNNGSSWVAVGSGSYMSDLSDDTTPELGGDFSAGSYNMKVTSGTTLVSADCDHADEAGRVFVDTDAATGQQWYVCEGVAGWVVQGGGTTAFNDIGDADAAGTINLTTYQQILTSTLNAVGAVLSMTNTTADLTSTSAFIDLKYTDDGDVDGYFIRGYDNSGADLKFSIGPDGAFTGLSFTANPTATPSSTYVDSDTTDEDTSAQWVVNCTDTGSGTEDCDITISQQKAGAMTAVITMDADGDVVVANFQDASLTVEGDVELATTAEIDAGTDSTRAMPVDQFVASKRNVTWLVFNLVEAATDTATATNIYGDFESPIAGTVLQSDTTPFYLYATNSTAGTTGTMVVDISFNGTSIMTTNKLDFDSTEKTTTTASTMPDLTDTTLAVGDIITIDIDAIHTTAAKGLTVYMAVRE